MRNCQVTDVKIDGKAYVIMFRFIIWMQIPKLYYCVECSLKIWLYGILCEIVANGNLDGFLGADYR